MVVGPVVRDHAISGIKDLRYAHYSRHSAWATGKLFIDNCQPHCAQSGHFAAATAYFWDVFGPPSHFRLR